MSSYPSRVGRFNPIRKVVFIPLGTADLARGRMSVQKGRMYGLQLIQPRLIFLFSFPPQYEVNKKTKY
ncbi:hypothetical protein FJTKL_04395 [Diaporthe vaccinii]|uniref:Uncharacterized protein n=1 Tax=Diaporthe vaccinii TaxID=105482 RepID=A0ABR4F111_9PEZI